MVRKKVLATVLIATSLVHWGSAELVTAAFDDLGYAHDESISASTAIEGFLFQGSTGLGMGYSTTYGYNNSGCLYASYDNGQVATITISRADESAFNLSSIYLDDEDGFGSDQYTIQGFLGESGKYEVTGVDVSVAHTVSFSGWNNVDKIVVTATSEYAEGGYDVAALFDNITYETIPEPATLAFVGLFGGGVLVIRRVFMM